MTTFRSLTPSAIVGLISLITVTWVASARVDTVVAFSTVVEPGSTVTPTPTNTPQPRSAYLPFVPKEIAGSAIPTSAPQPTSTAVPTATRAPALTLLGQITTYVDEADVLHVVGLIQNHSRYPYRYATVQMSGICVGPEATTCLDVEARTLSVAFDAGEAACFDALLQTVRGRYDVSALRVDSMRPTYGAVLSGASLVRQSANSDARRGDLYVEATIRNDYLSPLSYYASSYITTVAGQVLGCQWSRTDPFTVLPGGMAHFGHSYRPLRQFSQNFNYQIQVSTGTGLQQ